MTKYRLLQDYLMKAPCKKVEYESRILPLEEVLTVEEYNVPYNLFDANRLYIRKIDLNRLDEQARSLEKLKDFADAVKNVDELWIIRPCGTSENAIIQNYLNLTLKAYVYYIRSFGIENVVDVAIDVPTTTRNDSKISQLIDQ